MNPEVVALLTEALARAQARETIAVALVEVAPGEPFPTANVTSEQSEAAKIFLGLSVAAEKVRDTVPL